MNTQLIKSLHQKGVSLLEVLISVVILAVGVLGIASMLLLSNKANNSSYAKQQAVQTVYNILDKIRANPQAAINGNYNATNTGTNGLPTTVATPAVLCNAATCTPTQLATYDTWQWLTRDVSRLPNGSGSITTALNATTGNTVVTITVQWDDSPASSVIGAGSQTVTANPNFAQINIQSQI